tara:strand:+ start:676 stop:813 length:138 start_codon:yes stop_codon:yes gene_type:complete
MIKKARAFAPRFQSVPGGNPVKIAAIDKAMVTRSGAFGPMVAHCT